MEHSQPTPPNVRTGKGQGERRKRIIDYHMARLAKDRRRHPSIAPRGFEAMFWLTFAMALVLPLAITLMPLWAPHH